LAKPFPVTEIYTRTINLSQTQNTSTPTVSSKQIFSKYNDGEKRAKHKIQRTGSGTEMA